jgi:hypothetical protein
VYNIPKSDGRAPIDEISLGIKENSMEDAV